MTPPKAGETLRESEIAAGFHDRKAATAASGCARAAEGRYRHQPMKRAVVVVTVLTGALGGGVAALAMYVAWEHNPEGEFHEMMELGTQLIHWGPWAAVGVTWFAVTFIPLVLVGAMVAAIAVRVRSAVPATRPSCRQRRS
jgi:hypothetical protein